MKPQGTPRDISSAPTTDISMRPISADTDKVHSHVVSCVKESEKAAGSDHILLYR